MTRSRLHVTILFLLVTAAASCSSSGLPPLEVGGSGGQAQGGGGGSGPSGGAGTNAGQSGTAGGSGVSTGGAGSGNGAGAGGAAATGGSAGGHAGSAGAPGGSSSGISGAGGGGLGGAPGSDVKESEGCGDPKTLESGTIDIPFGGATRKYILRVPDDYDPNHPYRLVFAFAESGASATSVANRNYFTLATLDKEGTTIFVAPDAANGQGSWSKSDVELTDAILARLEAGLCIDRSRIFATGFSFGGAMSLALACTRADVFRGVAFFSGADLTGSCTAALTKPIAYYASQASQDSTGAPMPSSGRIKQAQFAEVNGCMPEPDATTFPAAGQPHRCTEYKGCSAGHPTKYCVFDGAHGWEPKDPGQSTSWNAPEAWAFITQF